MQIAHTPLIYKVLSCSCKAQVQQNRVLGIFFMMATAFLSSGCAVILPFDSLQPDLETTQSINPPSALLSHDLNEEDWRRAQSALSLAVDPQGSGQPVNWDNPASKKRGVFTPIGQFTLVENTICRKFISVLIDQTKSQIKHQAKFAGHGESRHEGQACRVGPGEWVMKDVKPLRMPSQNSSLQPLPTSHSKPIPAPPMPLVRPIG